ncbi:hypothetical protein RHSIM_Rhsim07G0161200 [Rhododendron simsii]|uniref:Uncharacterized protein n=1 Tax=Rhododendron simsii TaxID=118357 RepID=A0A834LJ18_RHOSS|nr:hypothetical protein RHSIM_Rhsim07G0161200 [Rhododendron simsii]
MSFWTSLKRSQPPIQRLPAIHRLQHRPFSTPPPPSLIIPSSDTDSSSFNSFVRWISGIAVGSTISVAGYWFSSYAPICPDKSALSFADWSPVATADVSVDDQPSNPKFFFGDAYRRKVFFNYEKRMRMRSPPEKVLIAETLMTAILYPSWN